MNRVQYIITKTDGEKLSVWGNGYEVNQAGILSIGQMVKVQGQFAPMLVLSLQPGLWQSIHQMENGRPAYESMGTIHTPTPPVVLNGAVQ